MTWCKKNNESSSAGRYVGIVPVDDTCTIFKLMYCTWTMEQGGMWIEDRRTRFIEEAGLGWGTGVY